MTTKRPRDSYRQRVFDAIERTTTKMSQHGDVNNKIQRLNGSAWATKNLVTPINGWGWTKCTSWRPHECRLPMGGGPSTSDMDFAHAVAHHMTPNDVSLHGPEFARNLIEATRKWVDEARSEELRRNMKDCKVKMRSWSPEAKEAARDRYNVRTFHSAVHELKAMLDDLTEDQ